MQRFFARKIGGNRRCSLSGNKTTSFPSQLSYPNSASPLNSRGRTNHFISGVKVLRFVAHVFP
jgi:hypothetical protein